MTPSQKLRSIADSTGLDGIADAIREIANEIEHNNAPAVPQGYEIHEIPADYSGLVWLEGQVRAVARRAQAATGPQGWTDADSDAARLALELECLLMDTKNLSVVSKWWDSANDALELHRQRLAATTAPAPAQGEPFGHFRVEPFGWTDCAKDDEGAIALYERPQEVGLTDEQTLKDAYQEGYYARVTYNDAEESDLETEWSKSSTKALISAIRAKGGK